LGTASDVDIAGLELIAADGWQPLSRDRLGEWVLRASNGFTGRANSVLPLGHPGTDIDTALDAVRLWYADRSLTPMIQLPLPLLAELGEALTARGWDHHNRTHVMVCDLDQLRMAVSGPSRPAAPKIAVTIGVATTPDAAWLDAFRYRGQPLRPDVVPILTLNDHSIFVSVQSADGTAVAIGRGAITDRWLGITAVEVTESYRRQGLGRAVMAALADYASGHGVRHVYLQVADDNHGAITLYESLGFVRHHDYVYRRWSAG
jgi:ribosomal protein S18 acetylase RimI-like enzyme